MYFELFVALLLALPLAYGTCTLVRWRAPARRNTAWKSLSGFLAPLTLILWAGGAWITPSPDGVWAALWLMVGLIAFLVALLLSTRGSPRPPSRREVRRARRRNRLVDPLYACYAYAAGIALLAAVVTRHTWS